MTDTGHPRPGDAARRALRAARERAEAERDGAAGTAEGTMSGPAQAPQESAEEGTPGDDRGELTAAEVLSGGGAVRPGDAARAALRAAVSTSRGHGAAPTDTGAAPGDVHEEVAHPEPEAGPAGARPAGGRPGDAAREALRAARREALRAEAAEPRRERRAAERSGPAAPRTAPGAGQGARTGKAKAAQDMRHYLATAFRMPTWAETPDEQEEPADTTTMPTEPTPPAPSPSGPERSSASPSPGAGGDPSAPASGPVAPVPAPDASAITPPAPEPATPDPTSWPAATPSPRTAAHPTPATPHVPSTMATPHRDTELRRTFPAFVPREAAGADGPFAGTWWGNAWVGALERGALDPKRLVRGRGYADQGHVDAITVTPGLVLAYVRGSRPRPYRVQVRVRTLEDEDWERFLDAAADRPGHIAALLDKELPQTLADCGVPLLPGPGDLGPRCSCPDSGHPCKHAAALCYQTARLLDADPFVLLLLRGRGEKELLDALSRRSAARAARAARERQPVTLPGVRATDALAPRPLPPLPPPLPVPPHPEQPPVYPSAPGGPDPFALDQLATDAAARAHALLGTGRDPVGELSLWQDAVRLAAARPGSGLTAATRALYATLADAAGRTPADLARAVAAWRQGGPAGLAVLEEPWDPPAGRFDRARPLLLAADLPAFRPWRNRLTHPRAHVQLRLGRDGLWYAYESEPGQDDWWPRGTPDLDPVGALTGLGIPDDL
ncbi:SWIM zinc finger family protein [Streptomyces sp. NPDC046727]|uniref:SWIM zinc finger family protein n=1 Tax=Streptomyces sp. NPDC046727 TaxID=3155373 RepID=UPI0033EA0633